MTHIYSFFVCFWLTSAFWLLCHITSADLNVYITFIVLLFVKYFRYIHNYKIFKESLQSFSISILLTMANDLVCMNYPLYPFLFLDKILVCPLKHKNQLKFYSHIKHSLSVALLIIGSLFSLYFLSGFTSLIAKIHGLHVHVMTLYR